MPAVVTQALRYLEAIGLPASGVSSYRGRALPYHLTDRFELQTLTIAGHPLVLAVDRERQRSTAETDQLMRRLSDLTELPAVYVTKALASYDRKRLIERRVAFLVPGNQLYLPFLAIDLREHFRTQTERRLLSPSAQAILLVLLQHPDWSTELTAAEIAAKLDYTPMTASRAARELAATGLVQVLSAPRGNQITLTDTPHSIWNRALPALRSPVQRTLYARLFAYPPPTGVGAMVPAGMTELARRSMLAAEGLAVYACTKETWLGWKKWATVLPTPDDAQEEVQIWTYPPALTHDPESPRQAQSVDALSLYLSLRDNDDQRVQMALDRVLEDVWPSKG